jgi:hypothetical protein
MNIEIPDELIQKLQKECKRWQVPHSQKDLEEMISSQIEVIAKNVYKSWKGYECQNQHDWNSRTVF